MLRCRGEGRVCVAEDAVRGRVNLGLDVVPVLGCRSAIPEQPGAEDGPARWQWLLYRRRNHGRVAFLGFDVSRSKLIRHWHLANTMENASASSPHLVADILFSHPGRDGSRSYVSPHSFDQSPARLEDSTSRFDSISRVSISLIMEMNV